MPRLPAEGEAVSAKDTDALIGAYFEVVDAHEKQAERIAELADLLRGLSLARDSWRAKALDAIAACGDIGDMFAQTITERTAERDSALDRVAELEVALRKVAYPASELLQGWQAKRELASGARGMGENILVEHAAKVNSISLWHRLERAIEEVDRVLAGPASPAVEVKP